MVRKQVLVAVPIAARKTVVRTAPNLHEADAPLQKPAGRQAAQAEVRGDRIV